MPSDTIRPSAALRSAALRTLITCPVLSAVTGMGPSPAKKTWSQKTSEGRWRSYGYEELLQRDKVSLDIFWLKDESLEDSANLPAPDVIAGDIVDDLRAALEQFEAIQTDLSRIGETGARLRAGGGSRGTKEGP